MLAAALRANRELACRIVELAGANPVATQEELEIWTEVLTSASGLDRVDLEVRVLDDGAVQQRVWIEAKLSSPFGYLYGKHQLVRYCDALQVLNGRRRPRGVSKLAVLVPSLADLREADWSAIKATRSKILLWQEVADEASDIGAAVGGGLQWRTRARGSDASLALANLETLIWFLACQTFGVSVRTPLSRDSVATYEQAKEVRDAVESLTRHVIDVLVAQGWTTAIDRIGHADLVFSSKPITLPRPMRWWERSGRRHAVLTFQISPTDERTGEPVATVWVGLTFEFHYRPPDGWLEQVGALGLVAEQDEEETGGTAWLGAFAPLASLIGDDVKAGAQAIRIAQWIRGRVDDLAAVAPKPATNPTAG